MVDAFSYHCSKRYLEPDEKKLNKNIKGIELEIDDRSAREYLDNLEYDGIITTPYNEDDFSKDKQKITLEYDGSVDWELIFQADTINPLLKRIRTLNEYGLNPDNILNSSGTSCHIHLNRKYLDKLNITRKDMTKAVEFNSFPLYLFSQRTRDSMGDWCRSTLACNIDDDFLTKANLIDRINELSFNRYNMLNLNGDRTDELRIFSNKCSFDYQTIRFYLEYTDMMIELAKNMKNKKYSQNINECIDFIDDFMTSKPRRKKFYEQYNIDSILLSEDELIKIRNIKLWNKVDGRINQFERISRTQSREENNLSLLRLIRDINQMSPEPINLCFNPRTVIYEDSIEEIRNNFQRRFNL